MRCEIAWLLNLFLATDTGAKGDAGAPTYFLN
jgi:hypothetical protein